MVDLKNLQRECLALAKKLDGDADGQTSDKLDTCIAMCKETLEHREKWLQDTSCNCLQLYDVYAASLCKALCYLLADAEMNGLLVEQSIVYWFFRQENLYVTPEMVRKRIGVKND